MLGPFIRFNSSWNAQHKLPQYFDNSIIFMEWARNQIAEIKFDSNGNVFEINPLWNAIEWRSPIDMKVFFFVVTHNSMKTFEGLLLSLLSLLIIVS
jgi:hypothetical protein